LDELGAEKRREAPELKDSTHRNQEKEAKASVEPILSLSRNSENHFSKFRMLTP